jgi:hypothetical protein
MASKKKSTKKAKKKSVKKAVKKSGKKKASKKSSKKSGSTVTLGGNPVSVSGKLPQTGKSHSKTSAIKTSPESESSSISSRALTHRLVRQALESSMKLPQVCKTPRFIACLQIFHLHKVDSAVAKVSATSKLLRRSDQILVLCSGST